MLNKKAVREFTLAAAKEHRHQPFERVSEEFFTALESELRRSIVAKVKNLPSIGKTIRPPY